MSEPAVRVPQGLPFPVVLTLLPTYRCSASCSNCCFASNPHIKERAPLDHLLRYIDEAVETFPSLAVLVVSGGEPFIIGDDLDAIIRRGTERGLSTRIVSNGFWAIDSPRADRRLAKLREAGLVELNISTGDEHAKYVEPRRVVNAVVASLRLGMTTVLVVECTATSHLTKERFLADPQLRAAARAYGASGRLQILDTAWMQNYDGKVVPPERALVNRDNLHLRRPCDSILSTVVISPSERLGMCCGLTREQIPELAGDSLQERRMSEQFADGASDLMKIWILLEGPERILAWAAEKDPSIEWENKYAHHCDTCREVYRDPRVRAVIAEHIDEKRNDLLLRYSALRRSQERSHAQHVERSMP